MRKLLLALAAVAIAWTATAAEAQTRKIRLGTEGAYPPFNFVDKAGALQGFDIDIGNALCRAMEAECEWTTQEWDGIIPGLLARKYDAIVASMSITEERRKKVDFTNKYYVTPARFVRKRGSGIEIDAAGLAGRTVGVQRATVSENFLRDNYGDLVDIKAYGTQDEANLDFIAGRVDLVIADSVVLLEGLLNTDAGRDAEFVGPDFTDSKWFGDGIGIAVRKGEDELLGMLNDAIDRIRADGTYAEINARYFDFDLYGS